MQDRYAGDIGDYGKIALLREIQSQGLSIAVNWYRVETLDAERNADGTFKQEDGKYHIPEKLRVCDEALADKLTEISNGNNRSIKALEHADFLPEALYYSNTVTVEDRIGWHRHAMDSLKDADVVFMDPDNGMLVKSVGKRSVRSAKYALYEEVKAYIERGQSVLVYNHRCRKQEKQYFHDICTKLEEYTGIAEDEILKITFPKCSVRDYLAVPASKDHHDKIDKALAAMEEGIWGQMGMCRIPR